MKTLRIVRFQDPNEKSIWDEFAVFTDLTEEELQKKVDEIVDKFYKEGFEDWSYDDIISELEENGLVKYPEFDVEWWEILA